VQDWAFQIGFLSELCPVAFLLASAAPGFFLKIAGDFFRQTRMAATWLTRGLTGRH